ncbi:GspH/FimT family pseudopilin [Noviherbaspirillum sedimenti]|uniref:Type II secretion system protein H n=1 Tax=Noviherbaspirillum sedimenti TaxID=2320865 RepID=A0A3A3G9D8_9BURK|nr:GspH/FimT family pseudopilin [Noviherbaspirillum sedimenti]RJG04611.1 prepilin-type N-terminal cleavage/methylation domain-containing protein [Noviherbaspirillum sedimenti]
MNIKHTNGFTLIELMITLSIAAILMALAAPNFGIFVLNSRMTAQSNDLLSAFQLARSEAIKRGVRVSLCKSANNTSCAASGTWAQGWIVFVDGTTAGTVDGTGANADVVLRAFSALTGNSRLAGSANDVASYVSFTASGATSLTANRLVSLCPPSPAAVVGRDIQIAPSGRVRVQKPPATACT